jgi:hypothetical protein
MTLKIAYFAPTVVVAGPVSPVEFSKIFNLAELLHSHTELNDANNVGLSIRGGQQIQVYPNSLNIDVQWLVSWLEEACQGYMDLITTQSGVDDLKYCQPKVTSIWTIRQTAGDYQEMHTHPVYPWTGSGHRTVMAFDSILVPREDMPDGQS